MSTVADRMHWVSSSTRLADQTYDQMGFRSERGTGSGRDSIFVGVYLKPPLQFSSYAPAILYLLLFCVAIAARAPFEGVTTFDSYQACV